MRHNRLGVRIAHLKGKKHECTKQKIDHKRWRPETWCALGLFIFDTCSRIYPLLDLGGIRVILCRVNDTRANKPPAMEDPKAMAN